MAYVLEADRLTKSFGTNSVFAQVRFSLKEGEKAGLVGPNGAGKTTLLNCLAGRENTDGGFVKLAPYATIGFLEQTQSILEDDTLLSAVMEVFSDIFDQRRRIEELEQAISNTEGEALEKLLTRYGDEQEGYERAGGFSAETQVRRVLSGLGFQEEQFSRPVKSFSGGEKTRIGLARILVREYPLLFLDEPTNHLDLDSVEWLEAFLKDYPGALLVISHDRYFLDHVTETTFDLENGKLKRYLGGYSRYALQKEEDRKAEARAFEKQQKEIAETEAYILRYKAGIKSKQARGRQTRLERLERLEKPGERRAMSMGYADILMRTGEKVLTVDQISFGYADSPDNLLLSGVSAEIREGERVALLGPNGVGKTTILKLITGRLKPRGGGIYLGPSVKPAYFDQEHQNLHSENTVLHEILDHYDLTVEETKGLLARFLFFAEDIDKKVSSLSGGEQGRLSLLKLTLEKGNFLVLDEPTNHLDIQSREIMEDYLIDFPGALLMVSHDRYFIDTLADRVLELTPGGLISYQGNYTEYRERKERAERLERLEREDRKADATKKSSSGSRQADSGRSDHGKAGSRQAGVGQTGVGQAGIGQTDNGQARSRQAGVGQTDNGRSEPGSQVKPSKSLDRYARAKLRQRLQDLEKEIADLEEKEEATIGALGDPDTYSKDVSAETLKELNDRLRSIQVRLPEAYREWEEVGSSLEDAPN